MLNKKHRVFCAIIFFFFQENGRNFSFHLSFRKLNACFLMYPVISLNNGAKQTMMKEKLSTSCNHYLPPSYIICTADTTGSCNRVKIFKMKQDKKFADRKKVMLPAM